MELEISEGSIRCNVECEEFFAIAETSFLFLCELFWAESENLARERLLNERSIELSHVIFSEVQNVENDHFVVSICTVLQSFPVSIEHRSIAATFFFRAGSLSSNDLRLNFFLKSFSCLSELLDCLAMMDTVLDLGADDVAYSFLQNLMLNNAVIIEMIPSMLKLGWVALYNKNYEVSHEVFSCVISSCGNIDNKQYLCEGFLGLGETLKSMNNLGLSRLYLMEADDLCHRHEVPQLLRERVSQVQGQLRALQVFRIVIRVMSAVVNFRRPIFLARKIQEIEKNLSKLPFQEELARYTLESACWARFCPLLEVMETVNRRWIVYESEFFDESTCCQLETSDRELLMSSQLLELQILCSSPLFGAIINNHIVHISLLDENYRVKTWEMFVFDFEVHVLHYKSLSLMTALGYFVENLEDYLRQSICEEEHIFWIQLNEENSPLNVLLKEEQVGRGNVESGSFENMATILFHVCFQRNLLFESEHLQIMESMCRVKYEEECMLVTVLLAEEFVHLIVWQQGFDLLSQACFLLESLLRLSIFQQQTLEAVLLVIPQEILWRQINIEENNQLLVELLFQMAIDYREKGKNSFWSSIYDTKQKELEQVEHEERMKVSNDSLQGCTTILLFQAQHYMTALLQEGLKRSLVLTRKFVMFEEYEAKKILFQRVESGKRDSVSLAEIQGFALCAAQYVRIKATRLYSEEEFARKELQDLNRTALGILGAKSFHRSELLGRCDIACGYWECIKRLTIQLAFSVKERYVVEADRQRQDTYYLMMKTKPKQNVISPSGRPLRSHKLQPIAVGEAAELRKVNTMMEFAIKDLRDQLEALQQAPVIHLKKRRDALLREVMGLKRNSVARLEEVNEKLVQEHADLIRQKKNFEENIRMSGRRLIEGEKLTMEMAQKLRNLNKEMEIVRHSAKKVGVEIESAHQHMDALNKLHSLNGINAEPVEYNPTAFKTIDTSNRDVVRLQRKDKSLTAALLNLQRKHNIMQGVYHSLVAANQHERSSEQSEIMRLKSEIQKVSLRIQDN